MDDKDIDIYRKNSYEIYWEASFNELLSEALIKKWSWFDTETNFLVLITASGSALAGWALWSTDGGKIIWSTIAVVVFLTSAANTAMKIPDRIKQWEERRIKSSEMVSNIESFRRQLKIYDVNKIKTEYENLENKWNSNASLFRGTDMFITDKLSNKVKNKVTQNIKEGRYKDDTTGTIP